MISRRLVAPTPPTRPERRVQARGTRRFRSSPRDVRGHHAFSYTYSCSCSRRRTAVLEQNISRWLR